MFGFNKKQVDNLGLPLMSSINKSRMKQLSRFQSSQKKYYYISLERLKQSKQLLIKVRKSRNTVPAMCFHWLQEMEVLETGHTEASVDISKPVI